MTTIKIEVWGKRALFSRPEFRVEKVSYDVMTPAAARGILEAIYWHPGMRYIIKSIAVLNPIKFERIKSNGVKRKLPGKSMRKAAEGRAPVTISAQSIHRNVRSKARRCISKMCIMSLKPALS